MVFNATNLLINTSFNKSANMKKIASIMIFVLTLSGAAFAQSTTSSTNPKQGKTNNEGSNNQANNGTDTQGSTQGANHENNNKTATQPGRAGQVNGSNTSAGTGKKGNEAHGNEAGSKGAAAKINTSTTPKMNADNKKTDASSKPKKN